MRNRSQGMQGCSFRYWDCTKSKKSRNHFPFCFKKVKPTYKNLKLKKTTYKLIIDRINYRNDALPKVVFNCQLNKIVRTSSIAIDCSRSSEKMDLLPFCCSIPSIGVLVADSKLRTGCTRSIKIGNALFDQTRRQSFSGINDPGSSEHSSRWFGPLTSHQRNGFVRNPITGRGDIGWWV